MEYRTPDFPFTILDVASLLRLNIRRRGIDQVYVDCPLCGDRRGKMSLNLSRNIWRCNYCGEGGGMLALYASVHGISTSEAYQEICEDLQTGTFAPAPKKSAPPEGPAQSERASIQAVHRTFSALLDALPLIPAHREHLHTVRGLTDEQIGRFGFKSTPPSHLCRSLTERLMRQGCTVQGVPGFYMNDAGKWTVKFHQRTAGIIIPIRGVEGLIRGLQVRLDRPIRDKDEPPEKMGTKYLPLSSVGKNMGTTSGSPVHFVGDPCSRVVYVTEGALKADVAHALTGRTFAATAGANNTSGLDELFACLRRSGTEEIIEAEDMDKYRNVMVNKGASRVHQLAKKHGMACRRLIWNPNYKGIDDWQLALRQKNEVKKEAQKMNAEQRTWRFRVYQLDLESGKTYPFAFSGIEVLHKSGYRQPPPEEYRLVYDGTVTCARAGTISDALECISDQCGQELPEGYMGHSLSVSDLVELYDDSGWKCFYRSDSDFVPVEFDSELAGAKRDG